MSGSFEHVSRQPSVWCARMIVLTLTACSPSFETASDEQPGDQMFVAFSERMDASVRTDAASSTLSDAAPLDESARPLAACAALGGVAPRTIAEAVERINALPAPASLPCFVASLPRPLTLVAANSLSSAQPSSGRDNPRIFIVSDTMTMSVVPDGIGRNLLEFGEYVGPVRSTKAELAFPLTRPVDHGAPYRDRPDERTVSLCGVCHTSQEPHPTIPGAFISDALRPAHYYEMTLADVQKARATCDTEQSITPRCEMLRALFDYGEVREGAFNTGIKRGF